MFLLIYLFALTNSVYDTRLRFGAGELSGIAHNIMFVDYWQIKIIIFLRCPLNTLIYLLIMDKI